MYKTVRKVDNVKIKVDFTNSMCYIGEEYYIGNIEKLKNLYDYNKTVFEEFMQNIEIKYDISMIHFLINNKVKINEMKKISEIISYPLFWMLNDENVRLSDYDINIVDFFKYIYSRDYACIDIEFINTYLIYLEVLKEKKILNKYNKFPHNLYCTLKRIEYEKIIRNDKKDVIKDIYNFHIEFYGSKCEYYITYNNKKYNLLNDRDRENLEDIILDKRDIFCDDFYLSEYYPNNPLEDIILSFNNKKYYTKIIKKDIFYLLKDDFKSLDLDELKEIKEIILNIQNYIPSSIIKIAINLYKKYKIYAKRYLEQCYNNNFNTSYLTNSFKQNLFYIDFLSWYYFVDKEPLFNKYKHQIIFNKNNTNLFSIYDSFFNKIEFSEKEIGIKVEHKDLKITKLSLLDIVDLSNNKVSFNREFSDLFYKFLYLCVDEKTKEKAIIIVEILDILDNQDFEILTYKGEKISKAFLKKINEIKIKREK